MAKVAFSKLKCKAQETNKTFQLGDETITVKQYLPIQEKLALIGRVLELAHEENYNFSNPIKIAVFRDLELLFAYTNISFSDKQKEDLPKLYDTLVSSGVLNTILEHIPASEYEYICQGIQDTVVAFYQYQNSALGIIDNLRNRYNDTEMNVEELQVLLAELAQSPVMQNILPMMGT